MNWTWSLIVAFTTAPLIVAAGISPLLEERRWWVRRMKARHRG